MIHILRWHKRVLMTVLFVNVNKAISFKKCGTQTREATRTALPNAALMRAHRNLCEEALGHTSLMIFQVIHSDSIIRDRRGELRPWGREMEGWSDRGNEWIKGWRVIGCHTGGIGPDREWMKERWRMDGRSTSDIDSIERFVFFVLHLSFISFSAVSEWVKSHKTICSDNAAAVAVGRFAVILYLFVNAKKILISGESSILRGLC